MPPIIVKGTNRGVPGAFASAIGLNYAGDKGTRDAVSTALQALEKSVLYTEKIRDDGVVKDTLSKMETEANVFKAAQFAKKGSAAMETATAMHNGMEAIEKQYTENVKMTPDVNRRVREGFLPTKKFAISSGYTHQVQQTEAYKKASLLSNMKTNTDSAVQARLSPDEVSRLEVAVLEDAWELFSMDFGGDATTKEGKEIWNQAALKATTQFHTRIVDTMQVEDSPSQALLYLESHKRKIDPGTFVRYEAELTRDADSEAVYTAATAVHTSGMDLDQQLKNIDKIPKFTNKQKQQSKDLAIKMYNQKASIAEVRRKEAVEEESQKIEKLSAASLRIYKPSPKFHSDDEKELVDFADNVLNSKLAEQGIGPAVKSDQVMLFKLQSMPIADLSNVNLRDPKYLSNILRKDLNALEADQKEYRAGVLKTDSLGTRTIRQQASDRIKDLDEFRVTSKTTNQERRLRTQREGRFYEQFDARLLSLDPTQRTTSNVKEIIDDLLLPVDLGWGWTTGPHGKIYSFELPYTNKSGESYEDFIETKDPKVRPEILKGVPNVRYDRGSNTFYTGTGASKKIYTISGDEVTYHKEEEIYSRSVGGTNLYWNKNGEILTPR
jgi:hypothetical protein